MTALACPAVMETAILDHVYRYAKNAFRNENSVFGPSFFSAHVEMVVECAAYLADQLEADVEIVKLAAWLHDVSVAFDPGNLAGHADVSARIATDLLSNRGYPADAVKRVAQAIALHSQPLALGAAAAESVCLSNADAAARILQPAWWLYYAFVIRKLRYEEGRNWLRQLYERQWDVLIDPARELVGNHYAKVMSLLA